MQFGDPHCLLWEWLPSFNYVLHEEFLSFICPGSFVQDSQWQLSREERSMAFTHISLPNVPSRYFRLQFPSSMTIGGRRKIGFYRGCFRRIAAGFPCLCTKTHVCNLAWTILPATCRYFPLVQPHSLGVKQSAWGTSIPVSASTMGTVLTLLFLQGTLEYSSQGLLSSIYEK